MLYSKKHGTLNKLRHITTPGQLEDITHRLGKITNTLETQHHLKSKKN